MAFSLISVPRAFTLYTLSGISSISGKSTSSQTVDSSGRTSNDTSVSRGHSVCEKTSSRQCSKKRASDRNCSFAKATDSVRFFHAPGTDAAILRTAQPTLYAVSHNAVSATHFHVQYQRRTSATAEDFRSVAPVGLHQIQAIPQGNRDRHAHQVLVEEVYIQVCLVVPAQEE